MSEAGSYSEQEIAKLYADVTEAVASFAPISLEEMDNVKLMSRSDFKFTFPVEILPRILTEISADYRVLQIGDVRIQRYESLYFDTAGFEFYNFHHRGKLNRYKLRFRKYVDSGGLSFFEIKFKNNKGRTIKTRVKVKEIPPLIHHSDKAREFLETTTPLRAIDLLPSLQVDYSRITLVSKTTPERLTIDIGLKISAPGKELPHHFPKLVIAEVKQDKADHNSPFLRKIRQNRVRDGGISKYCFGMYSLYEELKKNSFKPKVRFIHRSMDYAWLFPESQTPSTHNTQSI